jgi:hypothetical protein
VRRIEGAAEQANPHAPCMRRQRDAVRRHHSSRESEEDEHAVTA